jgi:adenine-specific DNA-methyltransferase
LVERLILALSNENDFVFDPFLGVGSTSAAAVKKKRRGMGCEIIKEYYNIAINRTKLAMNGKLKTRPMNKPIYDPKNPKINLEYEWETPQLQFAMSNKRPSYGVAK